MNRFLGIIGTMMLILVSADGAGLGFDTGVSPEAASALLVTDRLPGSQAGTWLRLREIEWSAVRSPDGKEAPLVAGRASPVSVERRRGTLESLRRTGYRLVAFLRWDQSSWAQGVRQPSGLRQLPLDLREPYERCRLLAATYGDLVDYWEIENEPDISFVEENPETYTAFLKACYLGIRDGRSTTAEGSGLRAKGGGRYERGDGAETGGIGLRAKGGGEEACATADGGGLKAKGGGRGGDGGREKGERSRVMMAALALPPGPYFEAFVSNGGLSYADAFNYHYYGYAEDFTGVYRQFRDAVLGSTSAQVTNNREPITPCPSESVLTTSFFPSGEGWKPTTVAAFDHPKELAEGNRALLAKRPLASEEPALVEQGRWLVSPGVTVEETAEGWRFHVESWAPSPLRPAMAELPLPDHWKPSMRSLLTFEYRLLPSPTASAWHESPSPGGRRVVSAASDVDTPGGRRVVGAVPVSATKDTLSRRFLPVFLTEYGYGLLGKEARNTTEGRERQREWFASASAQARTLGIEGAMAFILRPCLENGTNEFGLLVECPQNASESGRHSASGAGSAPRNACSGFASTLALETLLTQGAESSPGDRWDVAGRPPSSVVVDFVAGNGMVQGKNSCGYLLRGEFGSTKPAEGVLVLYNFGGSPAPGELALEGDAWNLASGGRRIAVRLRPGERREVRVLVTPRQDWFDANPVRAIWREASVGEKEVAAAEAAVPPTPEVSAAKSESRKLTQTTQVDELFEPYIRTKNGNLYQTWQRLRAREGWQRYTERLGNFTMAFYGRADIPWRFSDNELAALVFFFRPEKLPATFEIRGSQVLEFSAPAAPSN